MAEKYWYVVQQTKTVRTACVAAPTRDKAKEIALKAFFDERESDDHSRIITAEPLNHIPSGENVRIFR